MTTTRTMLYGDWRSGAYGANRRAHLFVYAMPMNARKSPACGVRASDKYRARPTSGADACYDCLAFAASGRA